jgi:hypothetical protein
MQKLFDSIILLFPAVIVFLLWIDLRDRWPLGDSKPQKMLLFSVAALSCNMLLVCALYVADLLLMDAGPMSQATMTEYKWAVGQMWCSRIAIFVSLLTLITALLSERGRARNLCILGSVAGLVWWPLVALADSDLVSVYIRTHR